jgi:polyvinyl alcohol dehydrogenase (cytochrome)
MMSGVKIAALIACTWAGSAMAAASIHQMEGSADAKRESPGKAVFERTCAQCHEQGVGGAPLHKLLTYMMPNAVYNVITKGAMRVQASRLSDAERQQVVEYLTGNSPGAASSKPVLACRSDDSWFDPDAKAVGTGWGIDPGNTRALSAEQAGLAAVDLGRLKLSWIFDFPDSLDVRAQPLVVGNALFLGSQSGAVYAMNARSGCVHWTYQAAGDIRSGIVYRARPHAMLIFSDTFAYTYALDAATGTLLWKSKVDEHPAARTTGTPAVWNDLVFVPVSSLGEEESAASSDYPCCTFRGSIVALDRLTGRTLWRRYTIPDAAVEQYRNSSGQPHLGPSGAGVWSSLTVDEKRESLYFATGDNYSDPADDNSDAVFAVSLRTGEVKWKRQMLAGDAFNDGCFLGRRGPSCPRKPGPDADFTAPPVLVHGIDGRDIVLAGQKSGDVFGLDPVSGRIVWRRRISKDYSSPLIGGIWFGMAVRAETLLIPAYGGPDMRKALSASRDPRIGAVDGIYALNAFNGQRVWSAPAKSYCERKTGCRGIQMALLTIPGAVLTGSIDGQLRGFDIATGRLLWSFDTAQQFTSLNGDLVEGGAITGAGAVMVAHGMLFATSSGRSNSVLLAFSVR